MFIINKYHKCYYSIINRAKSRDIEGYNELHHIVPKSLGGTNNQDNLVKLTAREHFICHLLLTKMTVGNNKRLMVFALNAMANLCNSYQNRYRSRSYDVARKLFSKEQSKRMSGLENPMRGKLHSLESKQKMVKSHQGKTPWNFGKTLSAEHRQKISQSNSGEKNPMFGKTHLEKTKKIISSKNKGNSRNKGVSKSEDHKKKISEKLKGKCLSESHKQKLKEVPKITCEHCGKLSSPAMYKRWHGNLCKNSSTDF